MDVTFDLLGIADILRPIQMNAAEKSWRDDFYPFGFGVEHKPVPFMEQAHRHHELEIGLLTSGFVDMQVGGTNFRFEAGNLAIFWAIIPHRVLRAGGNATSYVVTAPLSLLFRLEVSELFRQAVISGKVISQNDPARTPFWRTLFEQWTLDYNTGEEKRRQQFLLELQVFIQRFAMELASQDLTPSGGQLLNPARCNQLMRITQYMTEHFQEHIQLKDIAAEVGLNKEYCAAMFQRSCGMTLMNYLLNCRLGHARTLLSRTSSTILNVAMESGFGSVSQFHAVFKRETGMSPQAFRNQTAYR